MPVDPLARNEVAPNLNIGPMLFSAEQISARVAELGQQISRDYANRRVHLVGVLENGFVFMADLARHLTLPIICQFVRPELTPRIEKGLETVEIFFGPELPVIGQDVIVVEALVQSGITTDFFARNLLARGAASVKLCTLLDKQAERKTHLQPEYIGFLCDESFVVGYGLGAPHLGRNLPYIAKLIQ